MNEHAGLPPTAEEAAAQAKTIQDLREKLAAAERALFEAGVASGQYISTLQDRQARLEIALVMTSGRYNNLELGRRMSISRRLHGGQWLVYRDGVEVNFTADPQGETQRYDTALEAFDAAAKTCAPSVFNNKPAPNGKP